MNYENKNNNKIKWLYLGIAMAVMAVALFLIFRHRHQFMPATCTMPEICECGEARGTALGHSWVDATCEENQYCSECGEIGDKKLGHDYTAATCTQPKTCTRCGRTVGETLGHKFEDESCTEDSACLRCGKVQKALGHDFADANCIEPEICTRCGISEGEALGHDFAQGKCSRCGLDLGSLEAISQIKGLKAKCESDMKACIVNTDEDENPYDVVYDYGEAYDELVKNADWSLVFDAEYYKKTFPMLAMLYHYDDNLLLKHFQTVGVHEGRQGSESFNVGAYLMNGERKVYDAFSDKNNKNYECYYLYYMYNYDREKSVDTVNMPDGKNLIKQYKYVMTALQKSELDITNKYRRAAGSENIKGDSELDAIANYRAYINQVEGWVAHGWAENNNPTVRGWMSRNGSSSYGENEVEGASKTIGVVCAEKYYKSPEHKETLLDNKYKYIGMSNTYIGNTKNDRGWVRYNLDVYFTNVSSPLNP